MADGHRKYPVNRTVMHHAVSDDMVNWADIKVQDWFSVVGKSRGYKNGALRSYHNHPSRSVETYAMAHFCLHRYTKDKNKYGWRLTPLIKDVWNNVTWHASNWPINQQSIGIETAGNYVNKRLDEKALMLVADTFRFKDKQLKGKFWINGHKDFAATACPGQIYGQLPILIDMINNPTKWNKKLFPAPKPKPTPKPTPKPKPTPANPLIEKLTKENEDLKKKIVEMDVEISGDNKTIEALKIRISALEKKLKQQGENAGIPKDTTDKINESHSILKKIWDVFKRMLNK